ncbi:carbohydrate ABC transporter permease [Dactylosporangium aurantiacum]|uniref:Carbohydrate ABC transporter permease n=1 Tax=Dactylosporangium aurantiacum TaxID=35754 RepID=A0A9Q9ILI8_9ACTN|nr:carbohydrate ABC transporter permease [Dactylosporangium aurantiacum]MDG6105597.1 carbohydrate ABC transporter permease [Dactylosporangium aurantiacum]UWZ57063.1 carbohydrate ABC transporter permease [Dactylosporangium aurantiacum]
MSALPRLAFYTVCGLVALLFVAPLGWLVLASFKSSGEFAQSPPTLLPSHFSLENYRRLVEAGLWTNVGNSMLVTAGTVVAATTLAVLAGYGFARFRFPGQGVLFLTVLSTMMIPFQSIVPSLYVILDDLRLTNSLAGLVLVYTVFALPFGIFTMRAAFAAVPAAMEEAAVVDGAGPITALRRILLPIVAPGVATVAMYAFFTAWNEFLAALIFTTRQDRYTLPVVLANLQTGAGGTLNWGVLETGAVFAAVPCIAIFLILQRYYVAGLTGGAVKG